MILLMSNRVGNTQSHRGFVVSGTACDTTGNTGSGEFSGSDETNTNFHYEVEGGRIGFNFTSVGSLEKNKSEAHIYKYIYSMTGDDGFYFFRNSQIHSNGYTLFTGIKSMELKRETLPGFKYILILPRVLLVLNLMIFILEKY